MLGNKTASTRPSLTVGNTITDTQPSPTVGNTTTNTHPPATVGNTTAGTHPPVTVISANLQSLMIGHTFLVLIVPLLAALFYYSTPYSRRQPIFILNVLALILAFVVGLLSDVFRIHTMLSPENMWSAQLQLAIGSSSFFQSMLADAILLVRLITVYPLRRIGLARFAFLMSLPIMIKIARVVNLTLFIYQLSVLARTPNAFPRLDIAWLSLPYVKIEWIAQVVDNSYVSIAFIWTIRGFRANATSSEILSAVNFRQSSSAERIQFLSRLALSNFIIPSLISIAQLAVLFKIGGLDPIVLNDIAFVNAMVSVFGVVFATVWAGKERRREAKAEQAEGTFPSAREPSDSHGLPV